MLDNATIHGHRRLRSGKPMIYVFPRKKVFRRLSCRYNDIPSFLGGDYLVRSRSCQPKSDEENDRSASVLPLLGSRNTSSTAITLKHFDPPPVVFQTKTQFPRESHGHPLLYTILASFLQTRTHCFPILLPRCLRNVTCLIVSHDSGFLDNVTTDIIHYESKKLVFYPGNLSTFVVHPPEAKSYYTLAATSVKFAFPPPGSLMAIRSNTS